jgi:hypothetical protein
MIYSNTYTYKPLERYQIRLLELQALLSGNADEREMSGMILTLSLDEAVALGYQALSYTWGPPKLSERLEIQRNGGQGSNIYITKQLHSACCISGTGAILGGYRLIRFVLTRMTFKSAVRRSC